MKTMKTKAKQWTKDQIKAALPITRDELVALGISAADIDKGESRGELKTRGMWQIPVSYRALAISCVWTPEENRRYGAERESETAYGIRTMSKCRQAGYQLEGHTSVGGKSYRAFTSSQLFELEDGKLVNVATIHVCKG